MARHPRIKISGHAAAYHVVTRTRGKQHLLDDHMKDSFLQLLAQLKTLYYVDYAAYTMMNNHYHLLLNFKDPEDIDPKKAIIRWNRYHHKSLYTLNPAIQANRDYVVKELTDISSFMKRFNYHLTVRYNMHNGTIGTLWERRYRSSIVERGLALISCAAYIELNAFRGSLTSKPEDYRYSSIHCLKKGNKDKLISTQLLAEGLINGKTTMQELYNTYRAYLYEAGTSPHKNKPNGIIVTKAMQQQLQKHQIKIEQGSLGTRLRTLINGKATAGKELSSQIYEEYINPGYTGARAARHARRWLGLWGEHLYTVCSTIVRGSP